MTAIVKKNAPEIDLTGKDYLSTLVKTVVPQKAVKPRGLKDVAPETPRYQNYADIMAKITRNEPMNMADLRQMQADIKLLDQEAHFELCRMMINYPNRKIDYMVNSYGTHFDLVDLPADLLWQMHYYINLSLEDLARRKIKEEAHKQFQQNQENNSQFQKMQQLSPECSQGVFHQVLPTYNSKNVPTYEDLRNDALRNLQQSKLFENAGNPMEASFVETNLLDADTESKLGEPSEIGDYDE